MFSLLDFVFVGVVGLSALFAYFGGFVSELFGLLSWIVAALTAKYFFPAVEPKFIDIFGGQTPLASISAYALVFVMVVMLLSLFNKWWASHVRETGLSSIDASLGLLFGITRGLVVLSGAYIVMLWLMSDATTRPEWLKTGRSLPVIRAGAATLAGVLPNDGAGFSKLRKTVMTDTGAGEDLFERLNRPEVKAEEAASAEEGYHPSEMKDLERQLEQLNKIELDAGIDK